MSDEPGPSARTLVLVTLLGLVGCALVALLHPPEAYDPGRAQEQLGRHLSVDLDVSTSRAGDGWARGEALPLGDDGRPYPLSVSWVWFRPPEPPPQPGDRVVGRALLTQDASGTSLLLDGPRGARVVEGPLPVPVHWDTLLSHPQALAGRLLLVNGEVDGDRLRDPTGTASCPLAGVVEHVPVASGWLLRLEPAPDRPGWVCRLEGPA